MTVLMIMIQAQEHKTVTQHTKSALDAVYPIAWPGSRLQSLAQPIFFPFHDRLQPKEAAQPGKPSVGKFTPPSPSRQGGRATD